MLYLKQALRININIHEKMNSVNQQISYGIICHLSHIPDKTQGYDFVRKQDDKPLFELSEAGKIAVKLGDGTFRQWTNDTRIHRL